MTEQIYSFNTKENPLLTEVGGKAQSLISTTQAGLPVPGGLTLTVDFFQPWTDQIKASAEAGIGGLHIGSSAIFGLTPWRSTIKKPMTPKIWLFLTSTVNGIPIRIS